MGQLHLLSYSFSCVIWFQGHLRCIFQLLCNSFDCLWTLHGIWGYWDGSAFLRFRFRRRAALQASCFWESWAIQSWLQLPSLCDGRNTCNFVVSFIDLRKVTLPKLLFKVKDIILYLLECTLFSSTRLTALIKIITKISSLLTYH